MAAARTRPMNTTSSSRRIPKIQGLDGAVRSFVEYLYELAVVS